MSSMALGAMLQSGGDGDFNERGRLSDHSLTELHNGFIQIGCGFLFWGINTVFVVFALYVLISQGLKHYIPGSSARRLLVGIACVMYATSSVLMGIILQQNITFSNMLGNDFSDETLRYLLHLRLVVFWLPKLTYMLSDAVVVWRAWALWRGNWIVRTILAGLVPATLFITIGCGIPIHRHAINEFDWTFEDFTGHTPWQFLCTFPIFCYLFTNAFSTFVIGLKHWQYRKNISAMLLNDHSSAAVSDALVTLTESGLLYCALWTLVLLVEFKTFNPLTLMIWSAILPQIACMYPMIVILLVYLQKATRSEHLILMSSPADHDADAADSPHSTIDIDYKAFRGQSHYSPRHSAPSDATFSTMQFGPPEHAEVPPPRRRPTFFASPSTPFAEPQQPQS